MLQPIRAVDVRFRDARTPSIRVESWSSSALTCQVRGFTKDGLISFDHVTNADKSKKTETFPIPDFPLMVTVTPATANVVRGVCYIRLTLMLAGFPVGRLCAGYLGDGRCITWPPGLFEEFFSGRGRLRSVTGTDPAAGAEVSEAVPTNTIWRIKHVMIIFQAGSATANRYIRCNVTDGTNILYQIFSPVITANQGRVVFLVPGHGVGETAFDTGGNIRLPLPPDLVLFEGWVIETETEAIQAADDYSAPRLAVEEWIQE